jgi:hypothetical protein
MFYTKKLNACCFHSEIKEDTTGKDKGEPEQRRMVQKLIISNQKKGINKILWAQLKS